MKPTLFMASAQTRTRAIAMRLFAGISMQLLAYYVAKENGCDIDKPKNLAKSVTVE